MPRNEAPQDPGVEEQRVLPGLGRMRSAERVGFMRGLLEQLQEQMARQSQLVSKLAEIEARLEVSEQAIQTTRDYILMEQRNNPSEGRPETYPAIMASARFVGVRIGTACVAVLQELGTATTEEIEDYLSNGGFRFRSGTPLREINAALMRHPRARRVEDRWQYVPAKELSVEASDEDAA